jgi:hypothetical protein
MWDEASLVSMLEVYKEMYWIAAAMVIIAGLICREDAIKYRKSPALGVLILVLSYVAGYLMAFNHWGRA